MSKFIKNLRGKSFNKIREKLTDVKPSSNVVIKANSKIKYKKEVTPQSFQYVIDTMEQVSPATEAKENEVYVSFPDEIYYATEMVDETYLAPYNYSVDYDYDYQYDNYEEYTSYYITDPSNGNVKELQEGDPAYYYNPSEVHYSGSKSISGTRWTEGQEVPYSDMVDYEGEVDIEDGGFYTDDHGITSYNVSEDYSFEVDYEYPYNREETYEYDGQEYTRVITGFKPAKFYVSGSISRGDSLGYGRHKYSPSSRLDQRYKGKATRQSIGHQQKTENRQYTRVVPGGRKKF